MSVPTQPFKAEAPGPSAGYIFQIRYALHRGLERLRRDPTGAVAIERYDDVAIIKDGEPVALDQLKHTVQDDGKLSDYSPGVWRTLANWHDLYIAGKLDLAKVDLLLTTNAVVSDESGLALLSPDEPSRDVAKALERLVEAAKSSTSKGSASDRAKFLALLPPERLALIQAVRIVAESPSLGDLTVELEASLGFACERGDRGAFREELEGWWLANISEQLDQGVGALIPLQELDIRISLLREKYKSSTLHIDDLDVSQDESDLSSYHFVKQIRWVKGGAQRIQNAQAAFLRASAQRSKWLREAKIDPAELARYDTELESNWRTQFAIRADELGDAANDDQKCASGRTLLGWAETQERPIKGAAAQFLTGGSYHALADAAKVGWHVDFVSKADEE